MSYTADYITLVDRAYEKWVAHRDPDEVFYVTKYERVMLIRESPMPEGPLGLTIGTGNERIFGLRLVVR